LRVRANVKTAVALLFLQSLHQLLTSVHKYFQKAFKNIEVKSWSDEFPMRMPSAPYKIIKSGSALAFIEKLIIRETALETQQRKIGSRPDQLIKQRAMEI
jgi:hypothetical protein